MTQHPGVTCNPHPLTGWPTASRMMIATGSTFHHYDVPGTYTVTVTGISTSCDGTSELQEGRKTIRWTAPA